MNGKITFQPLSRPKLVDDVVVQLQKKISGGELRYGDKIPTEPELMAQFGVGRSTVREAVRVLVHAGLLEKKQGYGTYLAADPAIREPLLHRLRRAELLEVYEVRKMLEVELSKLAAQRRTDADIARMREHLDRRAAALEKGDTEAYLSADVDFHMAVAAASGNAVMIDLFRTFSAVLLESLRKLAMHNARHDPHVLFHESLYEAIREGDEQAAIHWTLQNLDSTVKELDDAAGSDS